MEFRENAAWYMGDEGELRKWTKGFWRTDEKRKVHVPMARTLSALSAALLFCGSPEVKVGGGGDGALMAEALKQTGFYSALLQAAELASAYGGVYLRLRWDAARSRYPALSVAAADAATAQYVNGRLRSIAFRDLIERNEQTGVCYWLVQEYTDDGRILSRLHRGTADELGDELDLGALGATAAILPEADSGTGAMLAWYVPNRLPNAKWPGGCVGASDYDGLQGLFSALDEAYTALMRDVRLGKARIIVPMEFLRRKELLLSRCGNGAPSWVFDLDEEVFTALDINPQDSGAGITVAQSAVRAPELEAVIDGLIRRIFISAGYAPQSIGVGELGSGQSGVALHIRERLSMQTTEMKKTHWWHALMRICDAIYRLTQVLHGIPPTPAELSIAFPDNTQPDMASMADTVAKLSAAGAVSTQRMVELVSPDLAAGEVREETARIAASPR